MWNSCRDWLRGTLRGLAYRALLKPLPRPYVRQGGHCWRSPLAPADSRAVCSEREASRLLLFENRQHLGPAAARLEFVEHSGRGWYRHHDGVIDFSTSDNSDPNVNGRTYCYSTSGWLYERRSGAPTNLRWRDASPEAIRRDVKYALAADKYLRAVQVVGIPSVSGLKVLEIGPGMNCGWALVLACHGAQVITADPYPVRWQDAYHRPFLHALREGLSRQGTCNLAPIDRVLQAGAFCAEVLEQHDCAVERLDLPSESVDLVFSNAVAEHFYDPRSAFEELHRVTRPGGYGFHWIDYRDHRDFTRPLEYLLFSESRFRIEFGLRRGEIGNRLRAAEMRRIVAEAGFEAIQASVVIETPEGYLQDFVPRLRAAAESPYCSAPLDELRGLSDYLCVRRSAEPTR